MTVTRDYPHPGPWTRQAACTNADPDLFYPEGGNRRVADRRGGGVAMTRERDQAVVRGIPLKTCRACTAPIRFVKLDTGNTLPVDPMPNPRGNVSARRTGNYLLGYVISKTKPRDDIGHPIRLLAHHATCDNRAARTKTTKPTPTPDPQLF